MKTNPNLQIFINNFSNNFKLFNRRLLVFFNWLLLVAAVALIASRNESSLYISMLAILLSLSNFILGKIPEKTQELFERLQPILMNISNEEHGKIIARFNKLSWKVIVLLIILGLLTIATTMGATLYAVGPSEILWLTSVLVILIFDVPLLLTFLTFAKILNIAYQLYKLKDLEFEVDIFHLAPVYSIARLAQKLAFYILPYSALFGILPGLLNVLTQGSFSIIVLRIVIVSIGPISLLTSLFIFVFPLLWLRYAIIQKKEGLLSDVAAHINSVISEQNQLIQNKAWVKAGELKEVFETLIARQEYYRGIRELPWERQTLGEFILAFPVPIIIWAIQRYLETRLK